MNLKPLLERFLPSRAPANTTYGNQHFVLASLPMRGFDSVRRLSPASHMAFLSDIAGAGAISGYAAAQGAPAKLPHMGGQVDINGSGMSSGYAREPGQLLDLGRAMASQGVVNS